MKRWIVQHLFAWMPVLIRNMKQPGPFKIQKWVWLRRYTRVSCYKTNLGRYKTIDTVLGHQDIQVPQEIV